VNSLLRPFHLAVIDPAARVPELDNFNRLVLGSPELRLTYHLPALFGMSSLEKLGQKPDALVIFGSGASVNESLPWQKPLNSWLMQQFENGCPSLGICYGHQLMAHLFGGKVTFAKPDQEKYKGLREIQFLKKGFWGDDRHQGRFVVSHREIVSTLPDSFELVAKSSEVAIEAFKHKHLPIWGVQCHPEAGPEFIEHSEISLPSGVDEPFASGQDFMRKFIRHLLQQRIQ
jgi:GMP synthase-like glutamine amidotransferase